ncbi:MAG: carboxypeptidase-like regulatory domain-containing protein, partial [Candidatus Hydrothermarchaeaceae archaeon]
MGIRSLLIPFAYVAAVALKKAKISISSIVLFSFAVIFFTVFSFYMVVAPYYSTWFEIITIAGIFLTGFLDEVIRELGRMKRLHSLPLALARHSDLLLVFGILYISMEQPYGLVPSLNVGSGIYPAIGGLMLFGVLIVDFMARRMEKRDPGLESRAERMYLFTGFMLVGLYRNEFLLAIFAGLAGVTLSLYVWIFWKKSSGLFGIIESLYGRLLKMQKRVSAGGLNMDLQKTKLPSRGEKEEEEGFQEHGTEEYDTSGYSFTVVVNDRRSDPVSNVKVLLLNVETGETYNGYTDPSGRAGFVGVAEGQYNITLECEGFKKTEFERYVSMDSGVVFVLKRPFSDLSIVISDREKTVHIPNAEVSLKLSGKDRPAVT